MTSVTEAPARRPELAAPWAAPAPVVNAYRFEIVKLLAQWRIRIVLAACWLGPAPIVAVMSNQSSLPSDTVFGRWMGQSGWAGALVVLSFSCSWTLPLLMSLVAGDIFGAEDRVGTWRHLLVAVQSPRRIFAAKALAGLSVILVLATGLTLSSIVGGLIAVGDRPLVGLEGQLLSPAHAATAVLLAWMSALAPTLAFAAIGLLGSVALGRSPMGLLMPALLATVLQLAQLLALPVIVRVALPNFAFTAWRGLFTEPHQLGPLLLGVTVSLAWALVATALAFLLFLRRDFTDPAFEGVGGRAIGQAAAALVALFALTVGAVAVATTASGSGIGRANLETSLAKTYAHLYRMQSRELHRPDVTEKQLRTGASCDKGGSLVVDTGPGNDWRCVLTWHIPGVGAIGTAVYQLDVTPDGRYVADGDGPQEVNGFFQVRTATGDEPNPLWQFDGSVNLLSSPPPKG